MFLPPLFTVTSRKGHNGNAGRSYLNDRYSFLLGARTTPVESRRFSARRLTSPLCLCETPIIVPVEVASGTKTFLQQQKRIPINEMDYPDYLAFSAPNPKFPRVPFLRLLLQAHAFYLCQEKKKKKSR